MSHVCTSIGPKATGRRQTGTPRVGGARRPLIQRRMAGAPPAEPLEGRVLFAVAFTPLAGGDFNNDGTGDEVVFARARRAQRILAASGSTQIGRGLFLIDGVSGAALLGAALPLGGGRATPLVAAGDLNGDGRADLVVVNRSGRRGLDVLLNNGAGGFGAASRLGNAPLGITAIDVADFNADGRGDLVVTTDAGNGRGRRAGRGFDPLNPSEADRYLENRRQFLTGNFVATTTGAGVGAEAGGGTGLPGSVFLGAGAAAGEVEWTPGTSGATSSAENLVRFGGGAGARFDNVGAGAPGASGEAGGGVAPLRASDNPFFDDDAGGNVVVLLGNGDGTFQDATPVGEDDGSSGPGFSELD